MKKYYFLFFLLLTVSLSAQPKSVSLKAGYYFPSSLKSGVIFGADYGFRIDERLAILFGADFYYKGIKEDVSYGDAEQLGVRISSGEHLSKWQGWHLPLTGKIRVELPWTNDAVNPFLTAGAGYGFTSVSYEMFTSNLSASYTYSGFVWQLGGGAMFRLGARSHLLAELVYNGASFDKDDMGHKFTTLNSSGLILRAGVAFNMY